MNPDQTKNRHVEPATTDFKLTPYIVLVTVIVLGLSIFLYSYKHSVIHIDDVEIDRDIENLA